MNDRENKIKKGKDFSLATKLIIFFKMYFILSQNLQIHLNTSNFDI